MKIFIFVKKYILNSFDYKCSNKIVKCTNNSIKYTACGYRKFRYLKARLC